MYGAAVFAYAYVKTAQARHKRKLRNSALSAIDRCGSIAARARAFGYDVTIYDVAAYYHDYSRWSKGRLSTQVLIRKTGITRISYGRDQP